VNSPTPSAPMITLGELIDRGAIEVTSGFPCGDHNSDGAGVLQIRPFNVTVNATIALDTQKHVPASAAAGRPILETGDIVFNNTNTKELVGKTAVWNGPAGSVFSNHMTRIRPTVSGLSSLYLANAIHAHWVTGRSEMLARSHVAQASILGERFREIQIPWPMEAAQMIFADAFKNAQDSIQIQSEIIETLSALKGTSMRELFTRGLRGEAQKDSEIGPIPESWDVVPLGSLGRIGNGSTPKRSVSSYWEGGTYPWLTSSKVYDREIETADQFVTERALSECHLPKIQPGAILIAITGQGKTLGHCAVLKIEATTNQHVAYLATDLSRADPSFVRGYIETQYDFLRQVGGGGGSTKGALTCAFLRSLPIPFPSALAEQQEISATLDAIDAKIDLHKRKRTVLEELFRTLLHKLMTGEIRIADLGLSALQSSEEVAA